MGEGGPSPTFPMKIPKLRRSRRFWAETGEAYLYLLPTLVVLGLFTFYPFVNAFLYSAYDIRTRAVPGPVVHRSEETAWAASLARGRIPEGLAQALAADGARPDGLWVRLRESHRWVIRDEGSGGEYIVLREGESLRVHRSTTGWAMTPVGWDNFRRVFRDRDFVKALRNTTVYVGVSVPVTLILALFLATLLHARIRARGLFRLAGFLPYITPLVAITMVWQWIYDRKFGLLNYIMRTVGAWVGVEVGLVDWLNNPQYVMPALIIMNVWRFVGYQALILLAGMQGIDREYYEAARIDGAGPLQVWRKITVPLLTPQMFFLLVISLIGSFQIFDQVLILLQGPGPEKSALTMVYYVFTKAFDANQYGLASAASVVLFAIIFSLSLFQLTVLQKRVHYER